MRVVILTDMEGISGIVRWEQVIPGKAQFEEGRRLYTEDVNAAIRGAFDGGATEVIVMDWHGAGEGYAFNSLIPAELDSRCTYVVQERVPQYTAPFEEGCDAALLVGMHARAGTEDGVMNHTVFGSSWQNLWFNGTLVGETGVNAALCGHWECPVVFVTGDDATCQQARDLLGQELTTVSVKQGLGRFSAVLIPPVRARGMIEAGAKDAVGKIAGARAYDPGKPCEIVVEFMNTSAWEERRHRPGVEDAGDRRIRIAGPDWWTAWTTFIGGPIYQPSPRI